jgi:transcriptional regulator with XRE-family HTH domain
LTQEVLAKRARLARPTVSIIEVGETINARLATIDQIAQALGVSMGQLFGSIE